MKKTCFLKPARWFRSQHQRLGFGGCAPLQEVPPQQADGRALPVPQPLPPVAREAVCRRASAGQVQDVHANQSYERGLAQPAGGAVLQTRDRVTFKRSEVEEDLGKIALLAACVLITVSCLFVLITENTIICINPYSTKYPKLVFFIILCVVPN